MSVPTLLERQLALGGVPLESMANASQTYRFCRPAVLHFGNARDEYIAADTAAVLFDVSDRRQLELTGKDCRTFLHNFCTNDIKRLQAGRGCEALVANVKGRIVAHIFVFATDTSLWVEAGPGDDASLIDHLQRYVINADVQLAAGTQRYGQLLVSGPTSGETLERAFPEVCTLEPLEHRMAQHAGRAVAVRRVDLLGNRGYLLSVDRTQLVELWNSLLAAGARPGGAAAFHAARIAAGLPLHGLDLSTDNLAQEAARTPQAISFTKGCYLGQEPISRIDAVGHINRQLCRLHVDSEIAPEAGTAVLAGDGEQVGAVTSAALVPGARHGVALALLRISHCQPGTAVRLSLAGQSLPAVVGLG